MRGNAISANYLLPNTWEETGSTWRLSNLDVQCRPARSSTDVCQRGTVYQRIGGGYTPVEWALTPRGHSLPWDWYTKAMASTSQWANLYLETAFPFYWPPWQTNRCSELLKLWVRSTYMHNALTGHSNAKAPPRAVLAGSPPDCRRVWWEP